MKKRSKYRPRQVYNPLNFVLEGMRPVRNHSAFVNLLIRNHAAAAALAQGKATRDDLDDLIGMNNIAHALIGQGFGTEHAEVAEQGKAALLCIARRGLILGRFVPTGPELTAVNALIELHDAQLDVITVRDMEKAIETVFRTIRNKKATVIKQAAA